MSPDHLKQIDEDAIAGTLPDRLTVLALCATIRIQDRAIQEQREVIATLREHVRAVTK